MRRSPGRSHGVLSQACDRLAYLGVRNGVCLFGTLIFLDKGQKRPVLMSDIRGYSGIAQTIDPAQLAAQLSTTIAAP